MGLPLTFQGLKTDENPDHPENFCCCPLCGSLGVMHFEDQDEGENAKQHTCLRCNAIFAGCRVSIGKTLKERLLNSQNREDFKAIL